MTETAEKIMELFERHEKVEPGMVLTETQLAHEARLWGPGHLSGLAAAMEELRDEGYVIITAPHGLELTELGFTKLFG